MNKKSVEKKKKQEKEKKLQQPVSRKTNKKKIYIGYTSRVLICGISFIISLLLSMFFFIKTLYVEEEKVVKYQEIGTMDYKVYLKPNDFYESTYLEKNKYYIASLIDNINIDMNYQFIIDQPVNTNLSYQIVAKLRISGNQGASTLYEKEYILKDVKEIVNKNKTIHSIKENIVINYDYYNGVANRFKATYGVDATSDLILYMRINKSASNDESEVKVNINNSNEMSLTIPLSQKTLEIKINNNGINNTNSIVKESKVEYRNIVFAIIAIILFIASVALILKTLELIFVLFPKKSKYDKYINKVLNEYDRLIVETPSEPRLEDRDIIKISRFEELLDARDNLKRPIMYHNLVNHQKCYFYIEKDNTIYMLVIKATDLEDKNEKKSR